MKTSIQQQIQRSTWCIKKTDSDSLFYNLSDKSCSETPSL